MLNKKGAILILSLVLALLFSGCQEKRTAKIEEIESEVYTYITSTYDESNKAEVYKSDLDVKHTVAVYTDWKKPNDHTDLSNSEAVTLYYDDLIYFIYISNDGETLVQKSNWKFIHQNGYDHTYRPMDSHFIYLGNRYYGQNKYRRYVQTYGESTTYKTYENYESNNTSSDNKVTTGSNESNKIQTGQSVRSGSTSTRSYTGGGTSYGK